MTWRLRLGARPSSISLSAVGAPSCVTAAITGRALLEYESDTGEAAAAPAQHTAPPQPAQASTDFRMIIGSPPCDHDKYLRGILFLAAPYQKDDPAEFSSRYLNYSVFSCICG